MERVMPPRNAPFPTMTLPTSRPLLPVLMRAEAPKKTRAPPPAMLRRRRGAASKTVTRPSMIAAMMPTSTTQWPRAERIPWNRLLPERPFVMMRVVRGPGMAAPVKPMMNPSPNCVRVSSKAAYASLWLLLALSRKGLSVFNISGALQTIPD